MGLNKKGGVKIDIIKGEDFSPNVILYSDSSNSSIYPVKIAVDFSGKLYLAFACNGSYLLIGDRK